MAESDKMISFNDARIAAYPLNTGKSHITSDKLISKAEALDMYNLKTAPFASYANNQLVPKGIWEGISWEEIIPLRNPYPIVVNNEGILYYATYQAPFNVIKIDTAGTATTLGTTTEGPFQIVQDSLKNIYTLDITYKIISKITPSGVSSIFANDLYYSPGRLLIDSFDNLYVSYAYNSNVLKIDSNGVKTNILFPEEVLNIALDTNNNMYASSNTKIYKKTPNNTITTFATTLNTSEFITIDTNNNVYNLVSLPTNPVTFNILKINPQGAVTTIANFNGVSRPAGFTADNLGNVYVSFTSNKIIYKVNSSGTSIFKNLDLGGTSFFRMYYFDNNLYVSDALQNKLYKFKTN